MSAYICEDSDIASIAVAYGVMLAMPTEKIQELADTLKRENIESVNFRYAESTPFEPCDLSEAERMDAASLVDLVDCLMYQSCEKPDYDQSLLETIKTQFAVSGVFQAEKDKKAAEKNRSTTIEKLIKDNPKLVLSEKCKSSRIAATKNIRIELKHAFPGVKFSVTSSKFSMGNSISVSWTDGPTSRQVEEIVDKYKAGSFDGIDDSYTYSHSAWTEVFGNAKYINTRREYSDKMLASVIGRVCRHIGGIEQVITVDDYKNGLLWNIFSSGGVDVRREINIALNKHTYCITR